jgi:hypothetical protein
MWDVETQFWRKTVLPSLYVLAGQETACSKPSTLSDTPKFFALEPKNAQTFYMRGQAPALNTVPKIQVTNMAEMRQFPFLRLLLPGM